MVAPTDRELLRAETQERVDLPDFQHLSRQVLFWHESIAALLSSQSLIRGFELSVVDPTTLRVTPNTASHKGAIIVPELGAANNQAPHDPVTSYSVVVDLNPTAKDKALTSFSTGMFLHVYAFVTWAPAKLDQRVFWVPPTGPETTQSINTRFSLEWQLRVQPHYLDPPPRSVRVGTIWWSGVLTSGDLYQAGQMLFEGVAVDDGSAVEVPSGGTPTFGGFWQLADEGTIPDFDRDDDRWTAGAKDFASFAQMVLREIQELKSQSRVTVPKHWEKPPYGLSVRAAQACTFTIGEGTRLSEGNQNGVSDALNPGYRNIGPALSFLIAGAVTDGLDNVCIVLKPGKYSITSPVVIPGTMALEIRGSGPLTTELKITNNGKIKIETNGVSEASAGLTLAGFRLWGTTSDNLIEVQSSDVGTATTYRMEDLEIEHTSGASWLSQTQAGRNVQLCLFGVRTDMETNVSFLTATELYVSDCYMGHVYVELVSGTATKQVRVDGSHVASIRVDDDIGDVLLSGSTFYHLNFTDCTLVSLSGVEFIPDGSLEDALGAVDTIMKVSNTTRVHISSCFFRTHDDAADAVLWLDNCGRAVVNQTGFVQIVGATSVPSYGVRATNMTPGPLEGPKAILRECWLVGPGEVWVDGFLVEDCRFVSESATLAQGTMVANSDRIVGSDIEMAQGTPNKLFDGVGPVRRCRIDVGSIGVGEGEIVPTSDLEILDCEINLSSAGMDVTATGNIRLRDVIISGSSPNRVILRPGTTDKRVFLESVKSPMEMEIQGIASNICTLSMSSCDLRRFVADAAFVNVTLADSVFDLGASVAFKGSGVKGSVIATSCAFYARRSWSDGVSGSLANSSDAISDYGLLIFDDQINGSGIERIVIEECEFWQDLDVGDLYSAIWTEAKGSREIVVRNNNFHLLWPAAAWTDTKGAIILHYASRIVVADNNFWNEGSGAASIGQMLSVVEPTIGTIVTRTQISFDENSVNFVDPNTTMKFDTSVGRVVHVDDVATMIDFAMSFCRNKINARWGNPNPRVTWTNNNGLISATNPQGVAYENIIHDAGNLINSFVPTSPNGNMITVFAGAHADNFFHP